MTIREKKPMLHENVTLDGNSPIKIKWNRTDRFTFPWHFHSEYEIIYIVEGDGIRHVGDSSEPFGPNELVMMGSQLPHFWQDRPLSSTEPHMEELSYYVVQFSQSFMAGAIAAYPEMMAIGDLLRRSMQGIRFLPPLNHVFGTAIAELYNLTGFDRLAKFLKLLNDMALCPQYTCLGSSPANLRSAPYMGERLNKLLSHLNRSYNQKQSLNDTAQWFGMNATAFARYFKRHTGKTFVDYVNDLRIAYACKLLQNGHLNVTQTCFECGFNNVSNFNRQFKKLMKQTPGEYVASFIQKRG